MAYKKVAQSTKLPPLPKLKVRRALIQQENNKCIVMMSTLLNCWAANGEGALTCKGFEDEFKICMDGYKGAKPKVSSINYHAARLYPKLRGPRND